MYDSDLEDEFDVPTYTFHRPYPREFFMLRDTRSVGTVIGHYDGHDIAEKIIDCDGNRYTYHGLARYRLDGRLDLEALKPGQYVVEPCFVYALDAKSGRRKGDVWRRLRALCRFELAMPTNVASWGGRR
jgi:hypothetical protein